MKHNWIVKLVMVFALLLGVTVAYGQQSDMPEQVEKSWLLNYLENTLSTPDRQIRVSNISGALSSHIVIDALTISDRGGVWLQLSNVELDWSRLALLRGRLSVDKLSAERIDLLRKPLPAQTQVVESPESEGFALPQLPVAIYVNSVEVQQINFGTDVFGLASQVSLNGSLVLAAGELDTQVHITRLDGPGGQFSLAAAYADADSRVNIDMDLREPADGILANLLNIENKSAIAAQIKGNGTLDDLNVVLAMQADQTSVLNGQINLSAVNNGRQFGVDISGSILDLLVPDYQPLLGETMSLQSQGLIDQQGNVSLQRLDFNAGAVTFAANARILADGFLRSLNIHATIADDNGAALMLSRKSRANSLQNLTLQLSYGDSQTWQGLFSVDNLRTQSFALPALKVEMGGVSENLDDPSNRHVSFNIKGGADTIEAFNTDIAAALGEKISLDMVADWQAGQALTIDHINLGTPSLRLWLTGQIDNMVYQGRLGLNAENLAVLRGLLDRDLDGAVSLSATGSVALNGGAFDLDFSGNSDGLQVGQAQADNLLTSPLSISGALVRDEQGFAARQFQISNQQIQLNLNGRYGDTDANMDLAASLFDLSLINSQLKGQVIAKASARGTDNLLALSLQTDFDNAAINGKALDDTHLNATAILDNTRTGSPYIRGFIDGYGQFASNALIVRSDITLDNLAFALDNLLVQTGSFKAEGNIGRNSDNLWNGQLAIAGDDLSSLADLAMMEGSGQLHGTLGLTVNNGQQDGVANLLAQNVNFAGIRIDNLTLDTTIRNLFALPTVNGKLQATHIEAGNFVLARANATATTQGRASIFNIDAALDDGTQSNLAGVFQPSEGNNWDLRLDQLSLNYQDLVVQLRQSAQISLNDKQIAIENVDLALNNDGSLRVNGHVGDQLDLDVQMRSVPVSLANLFQPDLQAGGLLNGQAKITGSLSQPNANFEITGSGLTAGILQQNDVAALDWQARGQTIDNQIKLDASISGGGLETTIAGIVPLDDRAMDVTINLQRLPVAIANGFVPNQDLGGIISGTGHISGTLTNPQAQFTLNGQDLRAATLTQNGLAPLNLDVSAQFANQTMRFDTIVLQGPQGLNLTASGQLPLSGRGLDLRAHGIVPLAVANRILAERGSQASGTLQLDAHVQGSFSNPILNGSFSTNDGQIIDAQTNLRLNNIVVDGVMNGDSIVLQNVSTNLSSGGSINASGTISTNIAANLPANLQINFNHARYTDGELIIATINGGMTITGALLHDPVIAGDLLLESAEITVPGSFGGATLIDVIHRHLTPEIRTTLVRAGLEPEPQTVPTPRERPSVPRLRLTINAPNQIFVRGRGLDAEMGGSIRLFGPVTNIRPVGGFDLIRGRFSILTQRLTFDEGQISLMGDMNPSLNFVATTDGDDITVTVTITGTVDDLNIAFSSQPELPEDEVLARLLFNRSISELSPFQIAQLAAAAAELAGTGGPGIMSMLREGVGLDDLDVITDSEGNTGVRAGRYIRDNIYLGVEAGSGGSTKGTVNLDITRDLKAKGAVGSEGDSSVGVFYEKDY